MVSDGFTTSLSLATTSPASIAARARARLSNSPRSTRSRSMRLRGEDMRGSRGYVLGLFASYSPASQPICREWFRHDAVPGRDGPITVIIAGGNVVTAQRSGNIRTPWMCLIRAGRRGLYRVLISRSRFPLARQPQRQHAAQRQQRNVAAERKHEGVRISVGTLPHAEGAVENAADNGDAECGADLEGGDHDPRGEAGMACLDAADDGLDD